MKVELDIDEDSINELFVKSLADMLDNGLEYNSILPMFSFDEIEEKRKLEGMRRAFMIVAGWYGVEEYKDYEELLK
jgi:hypothetical protein